MECAARWARVGSSGADNSRERNLAFEHREAAVNYAMQFARDMDSELADKFIGMYVKQMDARLWRARTQGSARISPRGVMQD